MKTPATLSSGGRSLWEKVTKGHPALDATQLVQLEEACRAKDRLDQLDALLRGDVSVWAQIVEDSDKRPAYLQIDAALAQANATANLMKQLLAAMRLPDAASGKRPQVRAARGAYSGGGAKVSSLDKARAERSS